jgi:membrane fusion protein (multidrug efflux system)
MSSTNHSVFPVHAEHSNLPPSGRTSPWQPPVHNEFPAAAEDDPLEQAVTHATLQADRQPQQRPPVTRFRSRTRRAVAAIAAGLFTVSVCAVAVIGLGWCTSSIESTDDAYVECHVVPMAPCVSGRLLEVLVDDNQHVEAGKILVRIDPADYQVKVDQASAALMQAQGQLSQARAQLPVTEAAARQAEAQVKVAQASADKAQSDLRRYHQLKEESISQLTVNAAEAQQAITQAQLEAARSTAVGAHAQVEFAKTAIVTAEANVAAAKAQVAQARLNLSYCEIKAPMPGRITRKAVERGNYIQIGQPMFNVVPETIYVTANFKETQLTHMKPGQAVDLLVDAYPGTVFHGRVDSLMSGTGSAFALLPPENATGNFVKVVQRVPVKILLDADALQGPHRLVPGMSVIPKVKVSPSTEGN